MAFCMSNVPAFHGITFHTIFLPKEPSISIGLWVASQERNRPTTNTDVNLGKFYRLYRICRIYRLYRLPRRIFPLFRHYRQKLTNQKKPLTDTTRRNDCLAGVSAYSSLTLGKHYENDAIFFLDSPCAVPRSEQCSRSRSHPRLCPSHAALRCRRIKYLCRYRCFGVPNVPLGRVLETKGGQAGH